MIDILDTAPCGFLSFADDGTILQANATLLQWLGVEWKELKGRSIETLFSTGGRVFYQTHFFPLLKMRGQADEIYMSLRLPSDPPGELPVLANAHRREHEGEQVNDCVFLPMQRRNRYEDEILAARKVAQEADRAKDEFLAIISHELRSPLGAILGWTELLKSGQLDEAQTRHGLDIIERNGKAQSQLIEDILDIARLTSGKVRLEWQEIDFEAVVREVIDSVAPLADAKELRLEFRSEFLSPTKMRGDVARLRQVVSNLLSNAIKFTPQQGAVNAVLSESGAEIELLIRDTGQGIAPEFLPYIFEPFRQADANSNRRSSGLGIGLSLVRSLVEMHGGRIVAESTGQGQGSLFRVYLPH